jgi:DNA-directed RNA polymerase subunit beta'
MISKTLGFQEAYKGGLSIGLNDIMVPEVKDGLVSSAKAEVDAVWNNYLMGLITDNERYNQVIDIWTQDQFTVDRIH